MDSAWTATGGDFALWSLGSGGGLDFFLGFLETGATRTLSAGTPTCALDFVLRTIFVYTYIIYTIASEIIPQT